MDVVGTLGYVGQRILCCPGAIAGYISGNSLMMLGDEASPPSMLWREGDGISVVAVSNEANLMAIAPNVDGGRMEIVKLSDKSSVTSLESPTRGKMSELVFSADGTRLFGLSDLLDHHLIVWDVQNEEVLIKVAMSQPSRHLAVNPINADCCMVASGSTLEVITLVQIIGEFESRSNKITVNGGADDASPVSCLAVMPRDKVMVGTTDGSIISIDTADGSSTIFTKLEEGAKPSAINVTKTEIIVSDSKGKMNWFPNVAADGELVASEQVANLLMRGAPQPITCTAVDPSLSFLYVGSKCGSIFKVSLRKMEKEEDDDEAEQTEMDPTAADAVMEINPTPFATNQSGATLCATSFNTDVLKSDRTNGGRFTSLYVTGDHTGLLSFSLLPDVDGSPASTSGLNKVRLHDIPMVGQARPRASPVTSMEVLSVSTSTGSRMLALGHLDGWVSVVRVDLCEAPDAATKLQIEISTVFVVHLFQGAVTTLQASPSNTYLAVGSLSDSTVYVIDTGVVASMMVMAYITGETPPSKMMWVDKDMWVLTSANQLVLYKCVGDMKAPFELKGSWVMDQGASVHSCVSFNDGHVVMVSHESIEPVMAAALPAMDTAGKSLSASVECGAIGSLSSTVMCAAEQPSKEYAALGTVDGSVYVLRCNGADEPVKIVARVRLHSCPVLSLSFSPDGSVIISTSGDGTTFFSSLTRPEEMTNVSKTSTGLYTDDMLEMLMRKVPNAEESLWIERRRASDAMELQQSLSGATHNIREAISDLAQELHTLLRINESATELEQLDRREFVVDVHGKDALVNRNKEAAEALAADYHTRNMKNDLVSARIRALCWDSMEQKGCPTYAISDKNHFVTSFSVKKYTEAEETALRRTKRLRGIEIRAISDHLKGSVEELSGGAHRCAWSGSVQGMPKDLEWIANDGENWPCADVIARLRKRREEAEKAAKMVESSLEDPSGSIDGVGDDLAEGSVRNGENSVNLNDVFTLLYPPSAVRTEVQRRTQMTLLKDVVQQVKTKFNDHWKALNADKEDVIASVKSRNIRIEEILSELRTTDTLFCPEMSPEEIEGTSMVVEDSEIKARPFETEAMRIEREKAEEDKRRAEAEAAKNDVKGRALDEMMNGTLEVKKDVLGAEAMVKPEWMDDIPYDEMNEIQKREYDEFEDKFKQLQEEQTKYRKGLEAELKKLKTEITESTAKFDEKLKETSRLKVIVEREVLTHELHISQYALSIVLRERAWKDLKDTEAGVVTKIAEHKDLVQRVERLSAEVESHKSSLHHVQEEIKSKEKSFKRDLQDQCNLTFDQDALKIFTNMYRIRTFPEAPGPADDATLDGSVGGASVVDDLKDKDPFYNTVKELEAAEAAKLHKMPLTTQLVIEQDCPEGFQSVVDDHIWGVLNSIRSAHIAKELQEIRITAIFAAEKKKLEELVASESAVAAEIEALRARGVSIRGELAKLSQNIEVVLTVKQGQDEIQNDAVVTDYSKGLMLPTSVVHKYNRRIKELGAEKINVMQKIMAFRRKINTVEWESEHLSMHAKHLEEYFTDMQLLRVTRGLQRVIREGSDADQLKARVDRVVARKDYMTKDTDTKIDKLREGITNMEKSIEARTSENSALLGTITDLKKQVQARQQVQTSRDEARGPAGDPAVMAMRKMKRVVARRHLVDTARVQAEELDFLRHELDKVRQRTFPSFVRAAKTRLINPDQR